VQCVADKREGKKRDCTQSENRGNGVRSIFIVGVDGRLGGNDGRDTANRGSYRKQRGQLRLELECAT